MKDLTLETLSDLAERDDFLYLASAYSKYPSGLEAAHRVVCLVAAELGKRKIRIFCPIAHCHAIAMLGGIDPRDHQIWMYQDMAFPPNAGGLILTKMRSWEISTGMTEERKEFEAAGKPVWGLDPAILGILEA